MLTHRFGSLLAAVTILGLALLGSSTAPSSADTPTPPALPSASKGSTSDPSMEAALDPWVMKFNSLTTLLGEDFPSEVSDSRILQQGGTPYGWIAFKGDVPSAARAEIEKLGRITTEPNIGYSAREASQASADALGTAHKILSNRGMAASYRDNANLRIIHVVYDGIPAGSTETVSDPSLASLAATLRTGIEKAAVLPAGFAVDVTFSNKRVASSEVRMAGVR